MIKIWTDGSCLGNPGNGGWAYIINQNNTQYENSGGELNTTNNKMELMAVIQALTNVQNFNDTIEIYTDSNYVKNGISIWIHNWKKNGWKTSDKKDVKNKDLWVQLDKLVKDKNIIWCWIKGHNGDVNNEKVDYLARNFAKNLKT